MNRPPDWSDLDGLAHIPAAVLTRLPDGRIIAIWGKAQTITQWAYRPDPREPMEWWDSPTERPDAPDLGVTVRWADGYRMRWETRWTHDDPASPQLPLLPRAVDR